MEESERNSEQIRYFGFDCKERIRRRRWRKKKKTKRILFKSVIRVLKIIELFFVLLFGIALNIRTWFEGACIGRVQYTQYVYWIEISLSEYKDENRFPQIRWDLYGMFTNYPLMRKTRHRTHNHINI